MSLENDKRGDVLNINSLAKPKAEIGAYVESQGILVPRRFNDLNEALSSQKPFIIRSEHSQDVFGASGILESMAVFPGDLSIARKKFPSGIPHMDWRRLDYNSDRPSWYDAREQVLASIPDLPQADIERALVLLSRRETLEYCRLLGINQTDFEREVSFSYWEYIKGQRQIVVADSSVGGRYHIFTDEGGGLEGKYDYTIYENGKTIKSGPQQARHNGWPSDMPETVRFYESVRTLPVFPKMNSAIMETVVDGNKRYFLQYHKGREFMAADFVLDRRLKEGEVETDIVRGVTLKEGITCLTKFWYKDQAFFEKLADEDGSFDYHFNHVFSELMTRRRRIHFIEGENFGHLALKSIDMHLQKSKLFKPEISIFLSRDNLLKLMPEFVIPNGSYTSRKHLGINDYSDFRAKFHVTSDGRRAIIKRLPLDLSLMK